MPGPTFWVLEAVGALCVVHLWRRASGSAPKKAFWTVVVLVPVIGPLFYGALYEAPSVQDEDQRAAEDDRGGDD